MTKTTFEIQSHHLLSHASFLLYNQEFI